MNSTGMQPRTRQLVLFTVLTVITAALVLAALLLPVIQRSLDPLPEVGNVAGQDYRAEQSLKYISQVLTEQQREQVARATLPVYTPAEINIAREQLESLRTTLAYISSVRADTFATQDQKLVDLAAMEDIRLSPETAAAILALPDNRWQAVQQEAITVLERIMSNAIRPNILEEARNRVPSLVSLSLPETQASLVSELATAFVAPNSEFSESLTEAARQAARDAVEPVVRSFIGGQTVIRQGQVLDAADLEALTELGLIQRQQKWQETVTAAAMALLLAVFVVIYLRRMPEPLGGLRNLAIMLGLFLVFLFTARLVIPTHTIIPYAFPISAYSLTIAAMFGAEAAMVTTLPLAVLVGYNLPNSLELTLYYLVSSLFGVLALGRARRVSSFFLAGLAVAISGAAIIWIYRLPLPSTDLVGISTLTSASLFNGLASASLTILMQYLLANFLGMTTPMQLMDLTRPDHPLLQMILHEAPGTYQHSLQLANLAEQAAERINADPLLTRVGSLYHDVGKTVNPAFFIENQILGGVNPHEVLSPEESAAVIIHHVPDGMALARRYRLPKRIQDFIAEHHGTMLTRYQYARALKEYEGDESQIDTSRFHYPGPLPQSRETAILMLADGSEARVRAERPRNEDELRELIKNVIDERVAQGQLKDTDLSFNDLELILDSFVTTLRGIYHPRIRYPSLQGSSEVITRPTGTLVEEQPTLSTVDAQLETPVEPIPLEASPK
jgi:hypothetical protein